MTLENSRGAQGLLLDHNVGVYADMNNVLENKGCCCVIMGTGIGKTYVATEYLNQHNYKALVVSPRNSINSSWEKFSKRVEAITYQKLSNIYKDIDFNKYDVVICDEAHHIGAPTWGTPIKHLIDNKIIKVLGLTESSVRYTDGGRDVASEFFKGNVAIGETVPGAIEKKILNPVTYVGAMYNSDGLKRTLRGKIQSRLYAKLNLVLNKTPTIEEILKKHMPSGKRKGIIFASTIGDIQSAIDFIHSVYPTMPIKFVHSKQSDVINNANMAWFRSIEEGYICSVDMISEGVHVKGVNTLIMLRRTESVNLFNQQLGRCLDASSKEPAILFDLVNNKYSIRVIKNKIRIKTNSVFDTGKVNIVSSSEQLIIKDYTKDIVEVLKEIQESLQVAIPWTKEEDEIVVRYFVEEHKEIMKRLPRHTYEAIRKRAQQFGLTNPKSNKTPWTEEEDNLLREKYLNTPILDLINKLGRSRSSIRLRAKKLGITYRYDRVLVDKIIRLYKEEGKLAREIANVCDMPIYKVRSILSRYGAATKVLRWTKEEEKILLDNFPAMGYEVVRLLSTPRSKGAIRDKARELGLLSVLAERKVTCKKVRCVETGEIYDSIYALSKVLSVKLGKDIQPVRKLVGEACSGRKKTAYGYHWEIVK